MTHSINKPTQHDISDPLDDFYQAIGATMPRLKQIEARDLPQPYRRLLEHDCDMTPTLEAHYQSTLTLKVINKRIPNHYLIRQVALLREDNGEAVAYGAIRILLDGFDEPTRRLILDCRKPLGTILALQHTPHSSRPAAFFTVTPDDVIAEALQLVGRPALFGRHNTLFNTDNKPFAEVVEILRPDDLAKTKHAETESA